MGKAKHKPGILGIVAGGNGAVIVGPLSSRASDGNEKDCQSPASVGFGSQRGGVESARGGGN